MNILLDTQIFLWALYGQKKKIPKKTVSALLNTKNYIFFSHVNLIEIAIKQSLGKLPYHNSPEDMHDTACLKNYKFLGLQPADMNELANLPLHHKDPFDRLLIAQAKRNDFSIATVNSSFPKYLEKEKIIS